MPVSAASWLEEVLADGLHLTAVRGEGDGHAPHVDVLGCELPFQVRQGVEVTGDDG